MFQTLLTIYLIRPLLKYVAQCNITPYLSRIGRRRHWDPDPKYGLLGDLEEHFALPLLLGAVVALLLVVAAALLVDGAHDHARWHGQGVIRLGPKNKKKIPK